MDCNRIRPITTVIKIETYVFETLAPMRRLSSLS